MTCVSWRNPRLIIVDNGPECTPSACVTDEPDCYLTTSSTTTSFSTTTVPNETLPTESITITVTSGTDTTPGFYSDGSGSITPHSPPIIHSSRTADSTRPATSTTIGTSSTASSATCTQWNPPAPAVSAYSESLPVTSLDNTLSSSCIVLTWSGSTHTEVPTPSTPGKTSSNTRYSTASSSSSGTSATSTLTTSGTSGVGGGYPSSDPTSSGIQGTHFTGQGVRAHVVSTFEALVVVAFLPLLLL